MADRDMEHFEFARQLHGLGPFAAAQVANAINVRICVELLKQLGGDVTFPPGFAERVSTRDQVIGTRGLPDGSYRVWLQPMSDDHNHPGLGTRWERIEGSEKRGRVANLYEVIDEGGTVEQGGTGMVTLQRIDRDGSPISQAPAVTAKIDYLRREISGWRAWVPPQDLVEDIGGKAF